VDLAICADVPSLAKIKKNINLETINDFLNLQFAGLNDHINAKSKLSKSQTDFIINEMMTEFYYLNLADISLFFRRLKSAHYGELYNALSPEKVITWLKEYANERLETASNNAIREHNDTKMSLTTYEQFEVDVRQKDGKYVKEKITRTIRQDNTPKKIDGDAFVEKYYKKKK